MLHVELQAMRDELAKMAFTVSQYSGPLSYGAFPMVSSMPDPGSAGGLQRALTARTAKRMRGEPVEKLAELSDAARAALLTGSGALAAGLPSSLLHEFGHAPGWAGPVGLGLGAGVGAALHYATRKDKHSEKKADVSPASSWNGSINSGGRQPSSLPNPEQAGAMQAEIIRRVARQLEKRSGATTPAGILARSRAVGLPRVSPPPGPSTDTISKPKGPGFGGPLSGGKKGLI